MMGFFRKRDVVDTPSHYPEVPEKSNAVPTVESYSEEFAPICPPHTTERKLLTRIDFHVIPFLCIMYCK